MTDMSNNTDKHYLPTVVSMSGGGTVMRLPDAGTFMANLRRGIRAAGGEGLISLTDDELAAKINEEREARGLRAEAGMVNGPFHTILSLTTTQLKTGVEILTTLALANTVVGDAVYWAICPMVGSPASAPGCMCATREEVDRIMLMLKIVSEYSA